jgi:hypothetical protein
MELSTPMKATTILTVYAILMFLGFVEAVGMGCDRGLVGIWCCL